MNLSDFKICLRARPELVLSIRLPEGDAVPPHFHVTEVGHVTKKFVDCGGTVHATEACVLQAWVGSRVDDGHRLTAGKLAAILEVAQRVLPDGGCELPVEVEYEAGTISQFPVEDLALAEGELRLQVGRKHTDCLAKERCGAGQETKEETGCCAGSPEGGACCG